jgi:hypothetical protein
MSVDYVPFLKLKGNEIAALKALDPELKVGLVPFFDIAKRDEMSEDDFTSMVTKAARSALKNLDEFENFFLDNFDISDLLKVDGDDNYEFVVDAFSELPFIPVVGLDRSVRRNEIVFTNKKLGKIKSDSIAIRLHGDDFINFGLICDELIDLQAEGAGLFSHWVLIIDNRYCAQLDVPKRSSELIAFLGDSDKHIKFDEVIITGSSIPASISEILPVSAAITHARTELAIYGAVKGKIAQKNLKLGDYTVVSPLYSDANIPKEAMQNVITAKIGYSHGNVHYFARGASVKTHPRGPLQYNDIAKHIIGLNFYRGAPYSFGDQFLNEKAQFIGSNVTANSILKPMINLHISYMLKDYAS